MLYRFRYMEWTQYTLGMLAISQLLFTGLFFSVHHYQQALGRLFALFSVCLIAYILFSLALVDRASWSGYTLGRLTSAAPAVIWIIARYIFVDDNRIPRGAWLIIALYLALRASSTFVYSPGETGSFSSYFLFYIFPQLIMLGLALHTVYTALKGLKVDLVEERRRVRVPFVISMGILVAMVVGSGFFLSSGPFLADLFGFSIDSMPNELFFSYIFLAILAFNLALFRLPDHALELIVLRKPHPAKAVVGNTRSDADPALVHRIQSLIETDRLYAQPGLTIGDLAAMVPVQEYRLRRIINRQLGYRNFNQFLNRFRIDEATRRLHDPHEAAVSISNIAFNVGYSALSSFNKAFKETHGITPSQYRNGTPITKEIKTPSMVVL